VPARVRLCLVSHRSFVRDQLGHRVQTHQVGADPESGDEPRAASAVTECRPRLSMLLKHLDEP
jgi:hypothetical protein